MVKSALVVVVSLFLAGGLAACGTVEGAGKDIERAGQTVQEVFND